jgi:glycosyltransferase involved in cell wall biosynthesis
LTPPQALCAGAADVSVNTNIVLDLSRLLQRAGRSAPSGIDRVELCYARRLIEAAKDRLSFAAVSKWGRFGPLPKDESLRFVQDLDRLWSDRVRAETSARRLVSASRRLQVALSLRGAGALHRHMRALGGPVLYLLASHHHLDRPALFRDLKEKAGARIVCFIHDTIPIDFPEYSVPGEGERHRVRMSTVAKYADGVIVNSVQTGEAFQPFLVEAKRSPPVVCAPLGADLPVRGVLDRGERTDSYFVCVGTIEAKKNHLLLLSVWRDLARHMAGKAPRLVLIGRRGWYVESVINMLDRSTALAGLVEERSNLSDAEMSRLVAGARALLMPTFAEGYGLPVAEALALGTPVLCSDLNVLRSVGKDAPDYFDPLDGVAWRQAVIDYAKARSERREAQLARIAAWRPPSWDEHFALVWPLLERVAPASTAGVPLVVAN